MIFLHTTKYIIFKHFYCRLRYQNMVMFPQITIQRQTGRARSCLALRLSGNVLGKGLIDLLVHVLVMFKLFLPSVMLFAYKGYISIYDE